MILSRKYPGVIPRAEAFSVAERLECGSLLPLSDLPQRRQVARTPNAGATSAGPFGSWSQCVVGSPRQLPMNLVGDEVTSLTFLSTGKEDQRLVTSSPTGLFLVSMHGKKAIETPHSTPSFPHSSP